MEGSGEQIHYNMYAGCHDRQKQRHSGSRSGPNVKKVFPRKWLLAF